MYKRKSMHCAQLLAVRTLTTGPSGLPYSSYADKILCVNSMHCAQLLAVGTLTTGPSGLLRSS